MKMTKYEKQFLVSLSVMIVSFLGMYFTYPAAVLGFLFMLPFCFGGMWAFISLFMLVQQTNFGKWLSEDDK